MSSASNEAFHNWFRDELGRDCPAQVALPLVHRRDELWLSENLVDTVEHPPMVPDFMEEPATYAMAGFWGRGVNSYAFYLVDKREDHRRFFRLTYGGAYGNPEEDAANLLQYLDGYERWRAEREASLTGSTLMHNMGIDRAELILRPGAKPTIVEGTDEGVRWWQTVVSALEGT